VTEWDEVNENENAVTMPGPHFKKNSVKYYLSIILMVFKNNWLFEDVSPTGFRYLKRKLTSSEPEGIQQQYCRQFQMSYST
jgi:hypothetical protein